MDDRHVIITESFLRSLHRKMVKGWIVAMCSSIAFSGTTIFLSVKSARNVAEARKEITDMQMSMRFIIAEQRKVTESFVIAWENQQNTADLLVSWGSYVRERTTISNYNRENRPAEFTGARASK